MSRSGKLLDKSATVLFGLANSHSFRVATVSGLWDLTQRFIELWDARSGSLLWEKEVEVLRCTNNLQPRFSEDGRYLVVYDGNWIEVVNSAQSTGVVAANDCRPVAVAVANNRTRLAVADCNLGKRGFGPGALFEKSFLDEGRSPIDLISTCDFYDIELCYASDGDCLIMAGHCHEARVVVMFWDVKSGSTLNHVVCGAKGSSIEGPIFPIRMTQDFGGVEIYGVVLRLDDRRWFNEHDDENYENITTFTTITSEGKLNGKYVAEHQKVVFAFTRSELIFLQNRNYLWSWKGGRTQPKRMGRIDYKDMLPSKDILGFALSKGYLTLLAETVSPSLVFLGSQEQIAEERNIGSILLSKRKFPYE
jgi:hypothetical protein